MLIYLELLATPEEKDKFQALYERYYGLLLHIANQILRNHHDAEVYGDNVFEKDGIRRDRTGDGEKTRCLCGKRGIFNRDGPVMGPQIIRQLE